MKEIDSTIDKIHNKRSSKSKLLLAICLSALVVGIVMLIVGLCTKDYFVKVIIGSVIIICSVAFYFRCNKSIKAFKLEDNNKIFLSIKTNFEEAKEKEFNKMLDKNFGINNSNPNCNITIKNKSLFVKSDYGYLIEGDIGLIVKSGSKYNGSSIFSGVIFTKQINKEYNFLYMKCKYAGQVFANTYEKNRISDNEAFLFKDSKNYKKALKELRKLYGNELVLFVNGNNLLFGFKSKKYIKYKGIDYDYKELCDSLVETFKEFDSNFKDITIEIE